MHRQTPLFGILIMCVGISFFGIKDGFAKILVSELHPVMVAWMQFAVSWLLIVPFVIYRNGIAAMWPRPFFLPFMRGATSVAIGVLVITALKFIPLADLQAVIFVAPILVTALSPWLLKEHVGIRRWSAVIAGFIGVLIILRPDLSGERFGYLIALGAGVVLACYFFVNRKAANLSSPEAGVLHVMSVGAVGLAVPAFLTWKTPGLTEFPVIGGMAFFTVLGHFLLIEAFKHGPASLIAPFHYFVIISAIIMGYFVFGDLPEPLTWLGIAIVLASGIYIAVREGKLHPEN